MLVTHLNPFSDPLKVPFNGLQGLVADHLQLAVHLFVLHEAPVTARPQAPRVAVNDVSKHQIT